MDFGQAEPNVKILKCKDAMDRKCKYCDKEELESERSEHKKSYYTPLHGV